MTSHAFQTEVQQLLHLMIHSLYSEREIFLRELVSNASDACDKLRFRALTEASLLRSEESLQVEILPDETAHTLVIRDNGVGLTEAEAIEHLGTIAKSGTKAFLQSIKDDESRKQANLIGQFGVGFYSAFMIADKVVVESRAAGVPSEQGVRWESTGDGTFATETITKAQRGTVVTLHLKDDAKEFAQRWRVESLIKKYSDYLAYPVLLPKYLSDEDKKKQPEGATAELEQVNAGKALWTRPKDQITDEQYAEFYKAQCKLWDAPATRLHVTVEGTLSFTALLFVPTDKPMDLFERERKGIALYVRRVFVMDDCKDLLPEYLRFVRGVVDSDDLPLNVSREILQQQDAVQKLRKQLTKRILDHLLKLAQSTDAKEKETFQAIDAAFGPVLREAMVTEWDKDLKDKVARLVRWASTWTSSPAAEGEEARPVRTGLEDYVRRMPSGQAAIYFVVAPSLESAKAHPAVEGFTKRGFEVLFLADPVDEWVAKELHEFDGRKLADIARADSDPSSADEKKKLEEDSKTYGDFLTFCQTSLGDGVGEVRLSSRLAGAPCVLVGDGNAASSQMEEMMRRMGREVPKPKRTLELNPNHPLVQRLREHHVSKADDAQLPGWIATLRDQAVLAEGGRIADPAAFASRVQALLLAAVK